MTDIASLKKLLEKSKGADGMVNMLSDPKKPAQVRAKILMDAVFTHPEPGHVLGVFTPIMEKLSSEHGDAAETAKLKAKYEQALAELENGPVRPATFIGLADGAMPGPKPRLHVITTDGQERFPIVHKDVKVEDLLRGMTVFLDAKGNMALGASTALPTVGQTALFLRRLPGTGTFEVQFREEKLLLHASQGLLDAEEAGELNRGDQLLFCSNRNFAFTNVPADADRKHRFVDTAKVPEVIATRDIGRPHWILGWMIRRLRILLYRPDLVSRLCLRPRVAAAMIGPSGSGKTLTIKAFLHHFTESLEELTGRPDLGSRVIRAKTSDLLSEWLGRSDKNIEEFFDDIQALASEEIETADGRRMRLPVVVILEEGEGIARRRGDWDGGIYDRILGMMLQRLDDPTDDLGQLPIFFLTTSNRPDVFDAAMWRRLAGVQARFTRLDREGLAAVLDKKLKPGFPYLSQNGTPSEQLRQLVIGQVVSWLFSPNGDDPGQLEITLRDGTKLIKHRRAFLTGAVVEQALANAIDQLAFAAEESDESDVGLDATSLIDALEGVISGLADNVTAHNAVDYVDLPDHSPVANVRRMQGTSGRLSHLTI
jgi:hypothetical protein